MDPIKIKSVVQWPQPQITKRVRGFLGLTGYYRKFTKDYGEIAWPLTEQLKKNNSGGMIRHKSIASVLNMPDFGKEFLVGCEALWGGLGAVLFKKADLSCIIARRWLIEHQPSPLMRGN